MATGDFVVASLQACALCGKSSERAVVQQSNWLVMRLVIIFVKHHGESKNPP